MDYEVFLKRYHWKPSDLLGEGGFGKVYLAFDEYTSQKVAIKTCPVSTQRDSLSLQHEVALMKTHLASDHPNIVRYEACYRYEERTGEHDFAILQYYPDGNLQQLLNRQQLTEAQKINIATQILEGICHYQKVPIFHRDLKPANILMARDRFGEYVPKIGDFGISKAGALDGKTLISNTLQGGTWHYAAPEQLAGAAKIGLNTDLWSYGVLLYLVFTGELPYRIDSANASSQQNALTAHLSVLKAGLPLPKLRMLPEPFGRMVSACLVFDPNQRVKNAEALRQYLKSPPIEAPEIELEIEIEARTEAETLPPPRKVETPQNSFIPPPTPETEPNPNSKNHKKWIAGGISLTVLLSALVIWFSQERQREVYEPETVLVQKGTFNMGSNDKDAENDEDAEINEKPIHSVTLSQDYSMSKYEITVAQYLQFCQETNGNWPEWLEKGNEYHIETGKADYYKKLGYSRTQNLNLPIVGVSWGNATAYCKWLSKKTGKKYRLPTEAEWEYAARGGNQSKGYVYSGSNDLKNVAWYSYSDDSEIKRHPVGGKSANELGLFDMSGNVWEWCADWYDAYSNAAVTDPTGADTGTYRVLRGGMEGDPVVYCRGAGCKHYSPSDKCAYYGFRIVSFP